MDEATTETPEAAQEETGKGLRAQLERALKERNEYRSQLMEGAYQQIGLEADKGLGKAIAKEYDGPATVDALAKYANDEYGYTFEAPEPQHPQAQEIAQQQEALDQVQQTAGSVVPPTDDEALAKAEAEGDYQTTMTLKGQEMAGWFNG